MRNTIIITLLTISYICQGQQPFITTWKTDNIGPSDDFSIEIPTTGTGYDYEVDWDNDGIYEETGIMGPISHTYKEKGTYKIAIRGHFPRIFFNGGGDRLKIININQWGDIHWENMNSAFEGCENLTENAVDFPDLRNVISMSEMFEAATHFTGDISNWDVSNINWMVSTFKDASDFNSDISCWNVSNVNSIRHMFERASSFNQDISHWNVSNVTNLQSAFHDASSFDQNLGEWDINQITNVTGMFADCGMSRRSYNKTLQGWANQSGLQPGLTLGANNLRYCKGESARTVLTEPPNNWTINGDSLDCTNTEFITTWITSNPGTSNDSSITIPIEPSLTYNYDVDWNNDGVFDETGITGEASHEFTTPGTYTIRIQGIFPYIAFDDGGDKEKIINIDQWGDNEWDSFNDSFRGCSNLNSTAEDTPDLCSVTLMSGMFSWATSFNYDIGNWNTSNVTDMNNMFFNANIFNSDLSSWDVRNVTDMSNMFNSANIFNGDLSTWNVGSVVNMSGFVANTDSFNMDISQWDVSKVTDMNNMFYRSSVFDQDIGGWDVSMVRDMSWMFNNAKSFNQDLNSWQVQKVETMLKMFEFANHFNCNLDLWETNSLVSVADMFRGADSFNGNVNTWNMIGVTRLNGMFDNADAFNRDLSMWNVSNVTQMNSMFRRSNFDQNLGTWDIENVTDMYLMFDNSNMSSTSYDSTLIGWATKVVNSNVRLGALGLDYCAAEAARDSLILIHNWNIMRDLKDCGVNCTEISNNLIQGGSSNWNLYPSYWDEGVFPDTCHQVFISNHAVSYINTGDTGECFSIEIESGAGLIVESGAELRVTANSGSN